MSAILKLKEMPKCCIDCPLEYDSICCEVIEDSEEASFIKALTNGLDPWKNRLPDCPLEDNTTTCTEISGSEYCGEWVSCDTCGTFNNKWHNYCNGCGKRMVR